MLSDKKMWKEWLVLAVSVALCVILTLPFMSIGQETINDLDFLLAIYMILPILYGCVFCSLLHCAIRLAERLFRKRNKDTYAEKLKGFIAVEIGLGIICLMLAIFLVPYHLPKLHAMLRQTVYFKNLIVSETFMQVLAFWSYMCAFILCAFVVVVVLAIDRQHKTKKFLLQEEQEKRFKEDVNEFCGFNYEESDFYQQTGLSYCSLKQTDGTKGEFEVYRMLRKSGLLGAAYFFNREIPKSDGLTTELDMIVVHKKGIFVIENKHYTTRIIGNANDKELTLIDHSGQKRTFYNPIWQNAQHILALKDFLGSHHLYIDDAKTPIHSIVVFTANCGDQTDDIISGIDMKGSTAHICTSQNVYFTINQVLSETDSSADIDVYKTTRILSELSIRKKY